MYSKKINQLATNLNPQSSDLIPIGDATTGQLKTTTFGTIFGTSADGIISGGVVTWSGTGLLFNVSSCQYSLNGIRYTTAATTITLTAADPTNARIDVIAVNTSSAVVLITGTPSANPVEPQVDPATQIQLTNITVNGGSATPNIPTDLVYDENVETWTKTNSGFLSVNYANTVAPYTGTKSTLVIKGTSSGGGVLSFESPSILNLTDYSVLKFAIKLNRALIGGERIGIGIFYGGTLLGNYAYLYGPGYNQPLYGFDYSSTSWQLISVNLSSISATSGNFDRLAINGFFNVYDDIQIGYDRIEFQKINNQLPTSSISIGDKVNNATIGSVLFTGSGAALSQDNTNFYWDDTNNRLGLGNNTPSFTLDVSGTGRVTGNLTASSLIKSGGTASQILAANGSVITAGTNITISGGTISANDTDTGITSLNGLTALTQTFATGTSGTDFNISSATSTHTFNIPTASATNRGALSSSDWTTFNNKQNTITNPVTGTGTTNELSYWTSSSAIGSLTTATYPSLTELSYVKGVTSAIQTQLNAKQNTLTNPVTGTGTTNYLPKWTSSSALGNSLFQEGTNAIGLGVTPSAWSVGKAFEVGFLGNVLWGVSQTGLRLMQNAYYSSGDLYASTNPASFYRQELGVHSWYNAPSGTAGNAITFTQAMTLDASGRLGIGTTSPQTKIDTLGVIRSSTTTFTSSGNIGRFGFGSPNYSDTLFSEISSNFEGANWFNGANLIFKTSSSGDITANASIERMRITSSGNVGIGTTSPGYKLDVSGTLGVTGAATFSGDVAVNGVLRDTVTTNRQTSSYTLVLTDRGKLVEMNVGSANNLTVPLNSSVAFPVGTTIDVSQYGAGQTTFVATGGVTIRSTNGWLKMNAQYGAATLVKVGTDEWYLFGNINA